MANFLADICEEAGEIEIVRKGRAPSEIEIVRMAYERYGDREKVVFEVGEMTDVAETVKRIAIRGSVVEVRLDDGVAPRSFYVPMHRIISLEGER